MESTTARPIRKVAISDKLWDCLDQMALEMGNDREGLVNQTLFTFARLNGYLSPGFSAEAPGVATAKPAPAVVKAAAGPIAPAAPRSEPVEPVEAVAAPPRRPEPPAPVPAKRPPPPMPRAAVLSAPPPAPAPDPIDDEQDRMDAAARVLETAAEFERSLKHNVPDAYREAKPRDRAQPVAGPIEEAASEKSLFLMAEDGDLDKVVKERFVIGRGKHCDLVINSGKVSREHAAIVKDGPDHFIEDLGSSNGTWFNKQRIRRRKIEDGDEYFICSEKVKCVVR